MSEPDQKCENRAILKQTYSQKLFIAFKMAYSCCFSLRRNLDFLQKWFLRSTTGWEPWSRGYRRGLMC